MEREPAGEEIDGNRRDLNEEFELIRFDKFRDGGNAQQSDELKLERIAIAFRRKARFDQAGFGGQFVIVIAATVTREASSLHEV